MINLRNLLPLTLLVVVAVGFTSCNEPGSPMGGSWHQVMSPDADGEGMTIDFEAHGNKVSVHFAPRPDGGHDHAKGELTYTYNDETKAVTVKAELLGDGKGDTWSGKLNGETLELGPADTPLKFKKGKALAGH